MPGIRREVRARIPSADREGAVLRLLCVTSPHEEWLPAERYGFGPSSTRRVGTRFWAFAKTLAIDQPVAVLSTRDGMEAAIA